MPHNQADTNTSIQYPECSVSMSELTEQKPVSEMNIIFVLE